MKKIKLIRSEIEIPSVPNFLKENGEIKDIGYFTVPHLKIIAKEWTKNLLENSEKRFNRLNK